MSKKNKSNNNNNAMQDRDDVRTTKYPIQFPEVANMDEIGYYPDDLLSDRISKLEHERARLVEMKYDPYRWELELAYLHREKQLRSVRAERHEAYVRSVVLRGSDDEITANTTFGPLRKVGSGLGSHSVN